MTDPEAHSKRMMKFIQSDLGVESLALEEEPDIPEEEEEDPDLDDFDMGDLSDLSDFDLDDMAEELQESCRREMRKRYNC